MTCRTMVSVAFALAVGAGGFALAESAPTTAPSAQATTQPAVDMHNTKCLVSGDDVGDSKLTATYDGKIYHFCCDSCPEAFKKDPAKYAKAAADDPAKYGIKTGG